MKRIVLLIICFGMLAGSISATLPDRIVSLAPSITEILYELGLEDNIVAVTSFCDYPSRAKEKPKIGGMSNPSLEAIVSLRPDLVVITTDGNPKGIDQRLEKLGIKVYVFTATQISELPNAVRDIGSVLEVGGEADKLAERIDAVMHDYSAKGRAISDRAKQEDIRGKALFIIWPEPLVVAGKETAVDDVLNLLGWENIAADAASRYPKYSIEEIINRDPDVIFIGKMREDTQKLSQGILKKLKMLDAVKNGRVYNTSDALYRLGPRVVEGTEELAGYLFEE